MNKTMNEKNKKTIRKMNKYINTFPLDDQAIFILGCIPAIMYIIGARRNRPHTEEAI